MKKAKILLILFLSTAVPVVTGGIYRLKDLRFPYYEPAVYSESARELDNPYIGWYQLYNYLLTADGSYDTSEISEQEYGPGLVMLQFNLQNFADAPVSEAGLRQLTDILAAWHSTGRQLIVRFLYDWDGNAPEQEPESLSLILEHMSQTAEIVNRHTDCIYILQGIFVGSWGEMHSSNYMNEEDMLTLVHHLASVTNPDIFLAVRTPEQWRTIAQSAAPLSASEAFDGSLAARLSLFNDGFMGSETDLGTYAEADASSPCQASGNASVRRSSFSRRNCASMCPTAEKWSSTIPTTIFQPPYRIWHAPMSLT